MDDPAARRQDASPAAARPLGVPPQWTGAGFSRDYAPLRLDQLVERQAARTPDAVAISDGSGTISYARLVAQARGLARALNRRGIGREHVVAICIDRSITQVVGVLGILFAGAAYLPLDPEGPAERVRFMLEDAGPRAIVTKPILAGRIPPEFRHLVVTTDGAEDLPEGAEPSGDVRPPGASPRDLAYVMYTSGSTGVPKGVLNQHDAVSNHMAWMAETFPLSTSNRVLAKASALFDVSVWEWFWPLSQGASIVLPQAGSEKDPCALLDAIESHAISDAHLVPTLLRVLLERPDLDRGRSLCRVFCSGEALTPELRERFFERMPGPPALVNLYGPTEAAVHVTGWVCAPDDTGPVPIGRPLPNVRVYVVDEQLNPVGPGTQGELLIAGPQVARGYLGREQLTAERFIVDPFDSSRAGRCYRTGDRVSWRPDGVIDYHGRADDQVQLGGARVELGEIEAALRMHGAIGDAVVVLRESGSSQRLYAYLRRAHDGQPDPSTEGVRSFLATMLPDYMTPARYVWLDEFPVTPSGKVDRRALAAYDAPRPVIEQPFEAPRPGTEERLARIWRDELQLDRIGRQDDFHLLGGDSLSSIRLFTAIAEGFGLQLPLDEALRSPTVAALAAVIDARRPETRTSSIVPLRTDGDQPSLFLPPSMGGQLFFWRELVRALNAGRPVYGLSLPSEFTGPTDIPGLAAVFVADLLAFQKDGPYHLAGYSFSAALALEMAQQLRALGRRVGVLAMIDYGPGSPDGWSGRLRTAGHFVANLPQWLRYDVMQAGRSSLGARARRKLASVGSRVLTFGSDTPTQLAERAVDEIFGRDQLPESHRRLTIDHLKGFYRYRPSVYDGHVLLFWARCRPLLHSLSPDLGWEQYAAGGFDRIVVRCNHDNILAPPHVDVIAQGLDRAITTWRV